MQDILENSVWIWMLLVVGLSLALALVIAHSRQTVQRRVDQATRELEDMNKFQRILLSDLELPVVLGRITSTIAPGLGFNTATVYLFDQEMNALEGEVAHDSQGEKTLSIVAIPLETPSLTARALFSAPQGIEHNGMIALPVIGPTPVGANALCWLEPELRCTVSPQANKKTRGTHCPPCKNFAAVGVLEVSYSGRKPSRVSRLPDYAKASAMAVRNARLFYGAQRDKASAERRSKQLELLSQVGREASRSLELNRVLEGMAEGLASLGYARISVALVYGDSIRGYMTFVGGKIHWTGTGTQINFSIPNSSDPLARVARTGESLVILDASNEASLPTRVRLEGRTIGYVPITAPAARDVRGRDAGGWRAGAVNVLGVLAVDFDNPERIVSQADLEVIGTLAAQVGVALENARLFQGLLLERSRLAQAIENIVDGVLLVEGEPDAKTTQTVQANAAARRLLGVPERFGIAALPAQLRANLEPNETETANSALTLGETRLQVAISKHENLRVVTLQDLARLEAVERTKAELLSVMSHELRTPLTAIIGFVELMLSGGSGPLNSDQTQFLQTTLDASRGLHQTVLNLLNASMLEAGQFELNPKATRLEFRQTLERYTRLAQEKTIAFEVQLASTPKVLADGGRLELVMANLLSNALRYTPSQGRIRVNSQIVGSALQFSVQDSGPGLNATQLERLFARFARGRESREALEGAGLSLYVCKAIVTAHGGRIWAESVLGRGTTLHFTVPFVPSEQTSASLH